MDEACENGAKYDTAATFARELKGYSDPITVECLHSDMHLTNIMSILRKRTDIYKLQI